jgi:hypothetical protein
MYASTGLVWVVTQVVEGEALAPGLFITSPQCIPPKINK